MIKEILNDYERSKEDTTDDSLFYAQPRFVHHLDEAFRSRLSSLYRQEISNDSIVVDLMSSWTSHLPNGINYKRVIGHGLNQSELQRNSILNSFWVQNFNLNQKLPLESSSVDICLMVAAWQYLQYPEKIASEIKRIVRPDGKLIISFSNRAFWSKAPNIWLNASDAERIKYICNVLLAQRWEIINTISEQSSSNSFWKTLTGQTDPFYSVIAKNTI